MGSSYSHPASHSGASAKGSGASRSAFHRWGIVGRPTWWLLKPLAAPRGYCFIASWCALIRLTGYGTRSLRQLDPGGGRYLESGGPWLRGWGILPEYVPENPGVPCSDYGGGGELFYGPGVRVPAVQVGIHDKTARGHFYYRARGLSRALFSSRVRVLSHTSRPMTMVDRLGKSAIAPHFYRTPWW